MGAITSDSSFWFALPEEYKGDISFVRSIKAFESEALVFLFSAYSLFFPLTVRYGPLSLIRLGVTCQW
jgi:hypothetical protein